MIFHLFDEIFVKECYLDFFLLCNNKIAAQITYSAFGSIARICLRTEI
jgi:hypothetical protein